MVSRNKSTLSALASHFVTLQLFCYFATSHLHPPTMLRLNYSQAMQSLRLCSELMLVRYRELLQLTSKAT